MKEGMISKNNKIITNLECLRMDSNMVNLSAAANKGELTFASLTMVKAVRPACATDRASTGH
jgi:hypothetical protein